MFCVLGDSFFVFVWGEGEDLKGGEPKARDLGRQPSASVMAGATVGKLSAIRVVKGVLEQP